MNMADLPKIISVDDHAVEPIISARSGSSPGTARNPRRRSRR